MTTLLTKGTMYLGKNLFGQFKECTPPDIDMETTEIKNGFGAYNLNTGVKAMTTNLVLTGFNKDVFSSIANPYAEINMTLYGSLDEFSNETIVSSKQAKLILRGASQKFALLGKIAQQENVEQSLDFNCSAAKLMIDGEEKYYVDTINLIWRVNGIDQLASMKRNLALN